MDLVTLAEAKKLEAMIKCEEANIRGWEELFKASEITITSPTSTKKMYLTGEKKDNVKEIIVTENKSRLAEYKLRFENL